MLRYSWIGMIALGFLAPSSAAVALGQVPNRFQAPPQSVAFEESGTLEGLHGDILQVRDSKSEAWWLKVGDSTKVSVTGEAEEEFLKPGIYVQLEGEIDKKNVLAKPVTAIEIISIQGKPIVGFFAPTEAAENDEEAKPVKNAEPGKKYRIRGKLVMFRDGEIILLAGRRITGDIAEKLNVAVNVDDLSIVQEGDEVEFKAWYYDPNKPAPLLNRPGKALAEEITVKLAKKLAPAGKKPRGAERPVRPTRSKSATRN